MAYSIRRSDEFTKQLNQTIEYIVDELASPRAAGAILDELERQLHVVAEHPCWFPIDQAMSDRFGLEIRRFPVRAYVAFYLISDTSETVHLITLRHQSQDISTYENYDLYEN